MHILRRCLILFATVVVCIGTSPTKHPIKVLEETQHRLENLIKNSSEAIYHKTIKYQACGRTGTKGEVQLVNQLKSQMVNSPSYRSYIQHHQQCSETKASSARRKRRSLDFGHLPSGTISKKILCLNKTSVNSNTNTFNMCTECIYAITLSKMFFPRNHKAVTCDNMGDYSCFSGEGVCITNEAATTVLYDVEEVGFEQLNLWRPILLQIPKSCSCEILQNTIFSSFI